VSEELLSEADCTLKGELAQGMTEAMVEAAVELVVLVCQVLIEVFMVKAMLD
jgi:hypothetical protein